LPNTFFTNIGGGETFLRDDLDDVVAVLRPKTRRMVVSTNGQLTDRIVRFAERFPDVGIRISIDGLGVTHDRIRGVEGSFTRAYRSALQGCEEEGSPPPSPDLGCYDTPRKAGGGPCRIGVLRSGRSLARRFREARAVGKRTIPMVFAVKTGQGEDVR